jgi:peptide-methionine (S)-S-oxide reductase
MAEEQTQTAYFALGCFWGAEKLFWQTPGVVQTAVGYMGGTAQNPSYQQVCSGTTGHAETVKVIFDPGKISYPQLLKIFLENHDPTQGNRQGNDVGEQYRSVIFATSAEQKRQAEQAIAEFQPQLAAAGYGKITTEVESADKHPFYLAEEYHRRYLEKNPGGYCPVHATGVRCG